MSFVVSNTITYMNTQSNWVATPPGWPMSINYCIDVDNNSLTNNDVLAYNTSNGKWVNKALSSLNTTNYSNADGGYYYETYTGIAGKVDGGTV